MGPIRRGIVNMMAKAFVGENLVAEGELMAQIVKENK
jgi:UDP-3-O-[3-hydroxymyristoyl] N-acetylglucosamine deacetylase/3-hydroxyacyl-[acyl-carrier-protein] dehydratase